MNTNEIKVYTCKHCGFREVEGSNETCFTCDIEMSIYVPKEAIAAAEQRGYEQARDEAARAAYQFEQKIQAAYDGELTEKEAVAALSFVGAYRDAIRAMQYEPEVVTK